MIEEQEIVLGCMPCVDSMKVGFLPYKNSTVAKCSKCNCDVWLGPKQKEVSEQKKCSIICLICIYKEHGPEAINQLIPLTDKKMGD